MEFSAAKRGGRPKLCPVGEIRFKEVSPAAQRIGQLTKAPAFPRDLYVPWISADGQQSFPPPWVAVRLLRGLR